MNETLKSILFLTLFSIGAGGIAIFFHSLLSPSMQSRISEKRRMAAEQIFPPAATFIEVSGKKPLPSFYWIGKKDSVVIGYAFPVETKGFSGTIYSLVGIDTGGTVLGIKIFSQTNMPALGMTIEDYIPANSVWSRLFGKKKSGTPWFIEQFKGANVNKPLLIDAVPRGKRFIDTIRNERNTLSTVAGAEASTRGMIDAIYKNAADFLRTIKGNER